MSDEDRAVTALSEVELYTVVRAAVEDAILGAIGTLLLVGLSLVLVWFGLAMLVRSATTVAGLQGGLVGILLAVLAVLVGIYIGGTTLGILAPMREWR